jgi:PAS domain S-box-containing protein
MTELSLPVRILIAEISSEAPTRYAAELQSSGYTIVIDTVINNEQFRAKAASGNYDLFICETEYQGWSFSQAILDLKALNIETPLIVITSQLDPNPMQIIDAGAFDCILKDRLYRLSLAVRRILTERRLRAERDRVENSLRQTAQTLETVIEASPLALITLDTENRIRMWNRGAEQMFGWKQEELVGQPMQEPPQVRKDGTPLSLSVWTALLHDQHGNLNGKLCVVADVTEEKRLAEERAEADISKRFRTLLESAPDAILEVDENGTIVVANVQAERLFRYHREQLVGHPVEKLIPQRYRSGHYEHRESYSHHPVTRPMGTGLDLYAVRSDGTEFAVDINLSPLRDDDGGHVICTIRDVSERRRTEEQIRMLNQNLELRNREVERANRLKSEFLASMSHELRTPLNAIIGFSELLGEQTSSILNEKQKRFLGHIQQGAKHLLDLINDILDLSKIEAGRLELRYENFTMETALGEVLSVLRPLAAVKNLQLESNVPHDAVLNADRVRFKQILYNLLSNAIKFTPEAGRVWIEALPEATQVTLMVGDTGIGIPPEEQSAIFDTFHQVGATTKGVREGTGLGLAITRRLVEQHGGKMWLKSEPGRGSEFYLTLPLHGKWASTDERIKDRAPAKRDRPLILIVEDDRSSQELMISYLESEGYVTVTAKSGTEAVRLAREMKPDVITLDMLLPGKSGFEAMHELKSSPATAWIPVLIVSVVDERKMGFALGATEYLVKPVNKDTLLQTIRKHLPSHDPGPILIVDDEAGALHLVSETLNEAGYSTLQAQSGMKALHILGHTRTSAVILDLLMPEMNGFELAKQIRQRKELSQVPIIVLTGKDLTDEDARRLQGYVTACLHKGTPWRTQLLEQLRLSLESLQLRKNEEDIGGG